MTTTQEQVIDVDHEPSAGQLAVIDQAEPLRLGELRMANYTDVLNKASEVSQQLSKIIRERKLFVKIGAKDHVYVDGWTTCGAMLGVAVRPVSCDENPTSEGEFTAVVEAIRTSDGFVLGRGIASCGPDERDWKNRSRQARRSMAQTRAAGKAMRLLFSWVMEMAGYATTPFEEMDSGAVPPHDNPPPDERAPKAPPRSQRSVVLTPMQVKSIVDHWKTSNPNEHGDAEQWVRDYKAWVSTVCGRSFNTGKVQEWTVADYQACARALGIESEV